MSEEKCSRSSATRKAESYSWCFRSSHRSIYHQIQDALEQHLHRKAHVAVLAMYWQGLDLQYFLLRDYLEHHHASLVIWNLPFPSSRTIEPHIEAFHWFRYGESQPQSATYPSITAQLCMAISSWALQGKRWTVCVPICLPLPNSTPPILESKGATTVLHSLQILHQRSMPLSIRRTALSYSTLGLSWTHMSSILRIKSLNC